MVGDDGQRGLGSEESHITLVFSKCQSMKEDKKWMWSQKGTIAILKMRDGGD